MHPEHQSLLMPRLCTLLLDLSSKDKIELQFIIKESAQKTTESNLPNAALSPGSPLHQQASSGQASLIFQKMVAVFQQFITLRMLTKSEDIPAYKDDSIVRASQCLEILCKLMYDVVQLNLFETIFIFIDNVNEVEHFIPYYEFQNDVIENSLDLKEEYPRWKSKEGYKIYLKGDFLSSHFLMFINSLP